MTPNEYRLIGMRQWDRIGRNMIYERDTLRIPYHPPFDPSYVPTAMEPFPEPIIAHEYRRVRKEFYHYKERYYIREMLLQDGKTWEVIERWVDRP